MLYMLHATCYMHATYKKNNALNLTRGRDMGPRMVPFVGTPSIFVLEIPWYLEQEGRRGEHRGREAGDVGEGSVPRPHAHVAEGIGELRLLRVRV
jgi:hypothetical protein